MTIKEIISRRLINQQIAACQFKKTEQVVEWLGAVQAQEYAMAKWSIGLRLGNSSSTAIEAAFNQGKILRTHLLRPTWHFVSHKDIHWILKLTAPRIHVANGYMCRKEGLDTKTLKKAVSVFIKILEKEKYLTRNALNDELRKNKIICTGHRLSYIMMHAELEGVVCSGPRQGNQFTYALLEERAGKGKNLSRDESLAELTSRYFKSRGPATIKDYCTWSYLSMKDAKKGIELVKEKFQHEIIDGNQYIFASGNFELKTTHQTSFLMPDYDEYGMGYKDRSAIFNNEKYKDSVSRGNPVFNRMIILNGIIEGTWQRTFKKNKPVVETFPFTKLTGNKQKALSQAVDRYLDFTGTSND